MISIYRLPLGKLPEMHSTPDLQFYFIWKPILAHRAFLAQVTPIEIPQTIQEALRSDN